tara:strand:- start:354 stop:536 length:183 start_codon:yes stop_codon:yes gene_type:complete
MTKNHKKIINKIQQVRSKNNVNWMNLLRLAFDSAPEKASKVVKQININDKKISSLLKKLT